MIGKPRVTLPDTHARLRKKQFLAARVDALAAFHNQCHDEQGRFCEGEGTTPRQASGFRGGSWYRNGSGEMLFRTKGVPKGLSGPVTREEMAKRAEADLAELEHGTSSQQSAHKASKKIMDDLSDFHPVLAGTVPLNVHTGTSDLDILTEVSDLDGFQSRLRSKYGRIKDFTTRRSNIDGLETVLANFTSRDGWPVEVFGQARPPWEQHAFIHMEAEKRLLRLGGERSVEEVRRLKAEGMKTEPAFAKVFGIPGDPYSGLVSLASIPEKDIKNKIKRP